MRKFFFIIGKSGSGKTTLVNYTLDKLGKKYNLSRIVSCITRPQRTDEIENVDFHFISDDEFDSHIKNDDFVEWESYAGFKHGLLKTSFKNNINCNYIKEITTNGLEKVIKYIKENYVKDEIIIIKVISEQEQIYKRLKEERHMVNKEIESRFLADIQMSNNINPHKTIYNLLDDQSFINAKKDFCNFVENELKEN
jgi:guanylate kinase